MSLFACDVLSQLWQFIHTKEYTPATTKKIWLWLSTLVKTKLAVLMKIYVCMYVFIRMTGRELWMMENHKVINYSYCKIYPNRFSRVVCSRAWLCGYESERLLHRLMFKLLGGTYNMWLDLRKPSLSAQEMKSSLLLIIKPTLLHYLKMPST